MKIRNQTKGYILGAISAISYGTNPLFAIPLYKSGMKVDSVLFYRYAIASVLMALLMVFRHQSFKLQHHDLIWLIVMGFLFSLSSIFLFSSYNYMNVGIASTILFVYPILTAVIMTVFFHEQLSFTTILSISLAVLGIFLTGKTSTGELLNFKGFSLALLSAVTYAFYIVGCDRSSLKRLSNIKLNFYAILFGSFLYIIALHGCTLLQPIPKPSLWIDAIGLGLFPTVISLIFLTMAIKYIGPTPTAILGALEPITALIIGCFIFNEVLNIRIISGIILVLMAVIVIIIGKGKNKNPIYIIKINHKSK